MDGLCDDFGFNLVRLSVMNVKCQCAGGLFREVVCGCGDGHEENAYFLLSATTVLTMYEECNGKWLILTFDLDSYLYEPAAYPS